MAAFGYVFYQFGWGSGSIALAVFVVVSVISGAVIISKPESNHFLKRIYSSIENQYAGFEKSGDTIRADAIKLLIDKTAIKYGEKLK